MNTLNKSSVRALLAVLTLGAGAASAQAGEVFELPLLNVAQLAAQADAKVTADVRSYLLSSAATARTYTVRRSPTVTVNAIETMVVEASRLPAMETVVVTATRLPIETVTVVASRLPRGGANEAVVVADNSTVRL
jgi:hypothetical protein